MYLKHLKINGFKSFAKKGELEFSAPVTAIVGPNGSGKSNVAEAFRFVLGEQSSKGLRAQKGADLIFNGSEKVSRSNRASVEVLLDNSSKVFPVDFDEIHLERIVYRDGQNDYIINGSKVRLKDIQELLAAANIGPSGHHIISQGEADRILSASLKERREMIEDALGLKVYQYKRQEAIKKLEKTKENIEKVESLRREVAPHLKFLHNQVKKMERAVALREKLSDFYQEYLYREDRYLTTEAEKIKQDKLPLDSQIQAISGQIKVSESRLEEASNDTYTSQIKSAEITLTQIRDKRQNTVQQLGQIEGQVHLMHQQIEKKINATKAENAPIPHRKVEQTLHEVCRDIEKHGQLTEVLLLQRALSDAKNTLQNFLVSITEDNEVDVEEERTLLGELELQGETMSKKLGTIKAEEEKVKALLHELQTKAIDDNETARQIERNTFDLKNALREFLVTKEKLAQRERQLEATEDEFKREVQEAVALIGRRASDFSSIQTKTNLDLEEDREQQQSRRRELEKLKIRLEEIGGVDEAVEKEYKEVSERDKFLQTEINDLESSLKSLNELIADLSAQLDEKFNLGVVKISTEFNRFFTLMFGGGEARLEMVKVKRRRTEGDEEISEEGVDILAKLPNKRVAGLDMLSGGERALTSIALIFAMSQVNPPLFIILDETDAALDEANSRRYGDMIEALAKRSQLILITHNRETMSRASILYGITMAGDGVSKLLSVRLDEAVAVAK